MLRQLTVTTVRWTPVVWLGILLPLAVLVGFATVRVGSFYVVSAPLLIGITLLLIRFPYVGMAALLGGFYYYPYLFSLLRLETVPSITIAYYLVIGLSSGFVLLTSHRARLINVLRRSHAFAAMLAFVGWMTINWLTLSPNNLEARDRMVFSVLTLLVPFLVAMSSSKRDLELTVRWLIGLGAVGILIGVIAFATNTGAIVGGTRFTLASAVNPLAYSYPLAMGAVLLFSYALRSASTRLWFGWGVYSSGVLFIILLTNTRGPLLALIAGLLTLLVLKRQINWRTVVVLVVVVAFVLVVLLPIIPALNRFEFVIDWLASVGDESSTDSLDMLDRASAGRSSVWWRSIALWQSAPIFGIGLGNLGERSYAHNFAIEILTEMGLVGLSMFAIFLTLVLRAANRLRRDALKQPLVDVYFALLAVAVIQMSFTGRIQLQTAFWFASGAIIALQHQIPVQRTIRGVSGRMHKLKSGERQMETFS